MVPFGGTLDFIVKMMKCRQMAHPDMSREVVVRYPHGHRSELLLVTAPHLTQRGKPSDILIGPVYP